MQLSRCLKRRGRKRRGEERKKLKTERKSGNDREKQRKKERLGARKKNIDRPSWLLLFVFFCFFDYWQVCISMVYLYLLLLPPLSRGAADMGHLLSRG